MSRLVPKLQVRAAEPNVLVIACAGGLSWEDRGVLAQDVERQLGPYPAGTDVVLDLGALEFVNSAGLGALFQVVGSVRTRGGRLVFADVPPSIARMFTAVGLDRLAEVTRDVAAAVSLLSAPARRPS